MVKESKIKLNLGSGDDYINGWINVDINAESRVDVTADLSKQFPFNENYADEIKASDILEHFTKEQGEKFIDECYRVLKKGGYLLIRTHNIFKIFKKFEDDSDVLIHFLYGDTSTTDIFGSHKFAFTKKTLSKLLTKKGFEVIFFDEDETNFIVKARKIEVPSIKINVGVVMQSPDIGGAETFMLSLIQEFGRKGLAIKLASNKGKFLNLAKEKKIKTYEIPVVLDIIGNIRGLIKTILLLPYAFYFYTKLLNDFRKAKVDVILMSNFTEKLFVSLLSPLFKIPVVWIEYGNLHEVFKKNFYIPKVIYRWLNKIPKAVIVPSKNTQKSLITDARVSLGKIKLVPLGIKQSNSIPQKHDGFVVGCISRITPEKGQEYLINAMKRVVKEIPDAKLLLVGDGPSLSSLKQLVKNLKLEKNVEFTGFVRETDNYYNQMDIFVFPSVWELEGFGLVLIEAMSHKLPVVASNVGPIPEIVDDNRIGYLVDVKNEIEFSEKIIELAKDNKMRKEIGEAGYEKFKKNYLLENTSNKIYNILYEATIK